MSTLPIAAGTIVYDRSGHEARYVTRLPNGGHLVRPRVTYYDGDSEDISYEGVAEWHEVFLKPPVEVLNAEVAALDAKLEDLRKAIRVRCDEQRVLDAQMATRKDRLKQHEQLAQLDDFIAGKITHFVIKDMGYAVEHCRAIAIDTFDHAMKEDTQWSRGALKLLTLFGGSKGDLTWRLNRYSDGSGSHHDEVIPCTSLDQARAIATRLYEDQLAAWRANLQVKGAWCASQILEHAKRLEQPIPQDAVDAVHREAVERARKQLDAARHAVAKAEGDLSAALIGAPADARSVAVAPLPA
jgi:hypothetical protein